MNFFFHLLPLLVCCSQADVVRVGPVKIPQATPVMSFYDLSANDIQGNLVPMDRYKGKKVLVVNTASECGYTPQYKQLQDLYETFKDSGLVVLGFPCNDFGGQEPGSEAEIATFCTSRFGVTFPMMAKVRIKGEPDPIFRWLTQKEQNGVMDVTVKWNFNKFLIDEQGRLVAAYGSGAGPLDDKILDWVQR